MYKTTNFFKQIIIQPNLNKTNKTVVYKAFENLYLESVFLLFTMMTEQYKIITFEI